MSKWNNKNTDRLVEVLLMLDDKITAKNFLRDLLTWQEIIEFGNRWQTARMLHLKKPYTEIIKTTGLSSTTIARISKWLNNGSNGYKSILNQIHQHNPPLPGKDCVDIK